MSMTVKEAEIISINVSAKDPEYPERTNAARFSGIRAARPLCSRKRRFWES